MISTRDLLQKIYQHPTFTNCINITLYLIIQLIALNCLKNQRIVIDLLTPFLTFLFISQTLSTSIIYIIWSSILLEGSLNYPKGFYLSSYWTMSILIMITRHYISWQKLFSWTFICIFTQILIILMEVLILLTKQHYFYIVSNNYFISIISRLLVTTIFSYYYYKKYINLKV